MKRNANRQTAIGNDTFNAEERENLKRICLTFNKVGNVLLKLYPLFDSVSLLSSLTDRAKTGAYFIKIGYDGELLAKDADKSAVAMNGVFWNLIARELNQGYADKFGLSIENEAIVLPEDVLDEVRYEIERQEMEISREVKRYMTQKRLNESKGKTQKLLELNDQPLFPGCWRKEAFGPRVYVEKLEKYKAATCVSESEKKDLQEQLLTNLSGFQGPAYNYDDHDLTERWMKSFEDTTGRIGKASDDEIIKNQIENLMENMLGKVQDDVCNDNRVLGTPPLGLGPAMVEREVWGIDCHTRRMLELILNEKLGLIKVDESERNDKSGGKSKNNDTHIFKIEEIEKVEKVINKNKAVTRFLEKVLLPAINAVPEHQAHKMDMAFKYIIKNPSRSEQEKKYAKILLDAMDEYADNDDHFRIHPKGTGVVCTAPEGIAPHVVITDYLGEMYPPYKWCEKLEIMQQAQREYDLKPALPEFHNILLERPRKDVNGYGLIFVDASQRGNMGSTCSHSCDANCTSAVVARDGELVIVLTTNRYVYPGEELCMDYFSVTSSEVEWRAAICLCGSVCCRGSFLHLATQDDLQQVLNQKCGPLYRVASLLRACTDKPLTEKDKQTLQLHGMGKYGLGGNTSQWLQKYAAETLRFVEFERQALPCALIRQSAMATSKDKKSKSKKSKTGKAGEAQVHCTEEESEKRPVLSFTAADMEARSVMEQRLQSLVCCFSMVSKFLSAQTQFQGAGGQPTPPPMSVLPVAESIDSVWKVLQPIPRLMDKHMVQFSTLKVKATSAAAVKAKAPRKKAKAVVSHTDTLQVPVAPIPPQFVGAKSTCDGQGLTLQQREDFPVEQCVRNGHPNTSSSDSQLSLTSVDSVSRHAEESGRIEHNCSKPSVFSTNPSSSISFPIPSTTTDLFPTNAPPSQLPPPQGPPPPTVPPPVPVMAPEITVDPVVVRIETAISDVRRVLSKDNKPNTMAQLRDRISELQGILTELHDLASPTARLLLLTDVLSMWKNTTNFVRVQEFNNVESGPIEVVARELASTTINKSKWEEIVKKTGSKYDTQGDTLNSTSETSAIEANITTCDGNIDKIKSINESDTSRRNGRSAKRSKTNGSGGDGAKRSRTANGNSKATMVDLGPNEVVYTGAKQYSNMFAFWQLIGWYYAGTDQEAISPDLFGTCMLPTPNVCFGESEDTYSSAKRDKLYEHLCNDKSQAMPWPAEIRKCFTTKLQYSDITATSLLGSPVLDTHLGQVDAIDTCLDEMFGAHRKRRRMEEVEVKQQLDGILPPEENTGWVQCDACMKWRRVPWNVNADDLPDQWFCKDNFWDAPERATCEASQDMFNPDKESTVFDTETTPEPCAVGDLKDVYCLRNEVFYEAKIVQIRPGAQEGHPAQALFHFKGWKKNTDEWIDVDSSRITPHHHHTDVTAKNPREQEKWQGRKNIVKAKSSVKRKETAASRGAATGGSKAKKKARR